MRLISLFTIVGGKLLDLGKLHQALIQGFHIHRLFLSVTKFFLIAKTVVIRDTLKPLTKIHKSLFAVSQLLNKMMVLLDYHWNF